MTLSDSKASVGDAPVVVVVVAYNSVRVIGGLLNSLPAAMAGVPGEVIVVDNGSADGTAELVDSRGDAIVIRAENRGYAAGINRGVSEAPRRGHILVLNADLRLLPGSVPAMLDALAAPGVGIVVPLVRNQDGTVFRSLRREPTIVRALGLRWGPASALSEYVDDERSYRVTGDFDWALGAAMLIARECYEDLGGWDESFFLYSEETDFCLRARDRGFRTRFEPAAEVVHIGGESGRSDATHAMQTVNRVRLYRRRHTAVAAGIYLAVEVLSEVSWALRGHRPSRAAVRALLRPSARPPQLGCSSAFIPR